MQPASWPCPRGDNGVSILSSRPGGELLLTHCFRGPSCLCTRCWQASTTLPVHIALPPQLPWRVSGNGQRCEGLARSRRLQSSCAKSGNRLMVTTCAALCRKCCSCSCWAQMPLPLLLTGLTPYELLSVPKTINLLMPSPGLIIVMPGTRQNSRHIPDTGEVPHKQVPSDPVRKTMEPQLKRSPFRTRLRRACRSLPPAQSQNPTPARRLAPILFCRRRAGPQGPGAVAVAGVAGDVAPQQHQLRKPFETRAIRRAAAAEAGIQTGLLALDAVSLEDHFRRRVLTLQGVPARLRGTLCEQVSGSLWRELPRKTLRAGGNCSS